jgi:hypothetical protein
MTRSLARSLARSLSFSLILCLALGSRVQCSWSGAARETCRNAQRTDSHVIYQITTEAAAAPAPAPAPTPAAAPAPAPTPTASAALVAAPSLGHGIGTRHLVSEYTFESPTDLSRLVAFGRDAGVDHSYGWERTEGWASTDHRGFHSTGPSGGAAGSHWYLSADATDQLESSYALVQFPVAAGANLLSFDYHMYGDDIRGLRVDWKRLDEMAWGVVWFAHGEQVRVAATRACSIHLRTHARAHTRTLARQSLRATGLQSAPPATCQTD